MVEVDTRPFTLATEGVVGTLYIPKIDHPFPAAVLIGGSDGREPQLSAARLAGEGFAALSVAYFGRPGLPPQLREVPLEYFDRALGALARALGLGNGPLVVMGGSRGSEAALLTGVHFPDSVAAVVAFDPGNVVLCSWPPGAPAWTLAGKALPYVSRFGPAASDPDAVIPVERIRGPILFISGGSDQVWPSALMARAMMSRLKAHNHPFPDDHLDFPRAGHGLVRPGLFGRANQGPPSVADLGANADRETALVKLRGFLLRLR